MNATPAADPIISPLRRRLPAAAVMLLPDKSHPKWESALERGTEFLCRHAATPLLESRLVPVLPVPGDPGVFDAALAWATELVASLSPKGDEEPAGVPLRLLIFPTVVLQSGAEVHLLPDPTLGDLQQRSPELGGDGVFLTSHASRMLELPVVLIRGGNYSGPSGATVPLVMAGGVRSNLPPWRNPELLGRQIRGVGRPEVEPELAELLDQAAGRVVGPLGVGKTRLVWEQLRARGEPFLWLRARPQRRPQPSLEDQFFQHLVSPSGHQQEDPLHPGGVAATDEEEIRRLLAIAGEAESAERRIEIAHLLFERLEQRYDSPVRLVFDDAERLTAGDREFVDALLGSSHLNTDFRMLLLGRPGGWDPELGGLPTVRLAGPAEAEMERLGAHMTEGLSLPEPVRKRFLTACGDNPLAFEEGLFGLLHERAFRRVYGSFFFGGDTTTEYRPSLRLVRHLEAEAGRLGATATLLQLSLAECPLPPDEVSAACAAFTETPDRSWRQRSIAAGLVAERESPWGPAVEIRLPAFRYAMSFTVSSEDSSRVRHELGQLLANRSEAGEPSWHAYRLLAGSREAIAPLLATIASPFGRDLPRDEMLNTLTNELRLHRLRQEDDEAEMELLWRLLPLARRMGQLQRFGDELGRAVELSAGRPNRLLAIAGLKAELEHEAGNNREAEATIRQALKAASTTDLRRQALLLIQLGKILLRQGKLQEAARIFESLRGALTEKGSRALNATCRFFLGNIALQEGRVDDAEEHHTAALEERRRQNLGRPTGSSYSALGAVAVTMGNYPKALERYEAARALLEEHGQQGEAGFALLGAGRALTRLGDFTGASKPLRTALNLRAGRDDRAGEAIARLAVASNYLALGRLEESLKEARSAHFQLALLSLDDSLAEAEQLLGRIAFVQRRYDRAEIHLEAALEIHQRLNDDLEAGFDHGWLLEAAVAQQNASAVSRHTAELKAILERLPRVDLVEILNFQVFRGLEWLSRQGQKVGDPTPYLDRAYRQVLGKARHLQPDQRNRFLSQIPVNHEIVEVATRLGVGGKDTKDVPA